MLPEASNCASQQGLSNAGCVPELVFLGYCKNCDGGQDVKKQVWLFSQHRVLIYWMLSFACG